MSELQFTDGNIILSGNLIDAILLNLSIDVTAKYDEVSSDSFSGSIKRPIGFSDARITATVELITDRNKSCYERLAEINTLFKTKKDGKIQEYKVSNKHINARGIRTVMFDNLTSSETDTDDILSVGLSFIEYHQSAIKSEQENVKKNKSTSVLRNKIDNIIDTVDDVVDKIVDEIVDKLDPRKKF